MKPRERVLAALDHRETDRVPVDFAGHRSSGIAAMAYPKLRDFLGLPANPVQISCSGMDAAELKAEFGKDITFWGGGCDTRDILPNGTPEQVAEHTSRHVEILRPGGGFVFQQVHNILANVSAENVTAMFDAVNS